MVDQIHIASTNLLPTNAPFTISRFSVDAHVIAQIWNRREKHGCRPTHQWFGDFSPGGLKTSQWTKFQVSGTCPGRDMHIDRISRFSVDAHVIAQIWNRREKHGCRPTHQWFGDFSPGGLKTSQWTKFQVSGTCPGRDIQLTLQPTPTHGSVIFLQVVSSHAHAWACVGGSDNAPAHHPRKESGHFFCATFKWLVLLNMPKKKFSQNVNK